MNGAGPVWIMGDSQNVNGATGEGITAWTDESFFPLAGVGLDQILVQSGARRRSYSPQHCLERYVRNDEGTLLTRVNAANPEKREEKSTCK